MQKPAFKLLFLALMFLWNTGIGCTIFVLTDAKTTLFFNNEDWSDPSTKIWFLPAENGKYGAAFVGFDNGWAQGGVNSEGLAFDWVAGWDEKWEKQRNMAEVKGNSSQRVLESFTTVEEAIAFYEKHWEPAFAYAKIMIADKSGASVIIGAQNNKLQIDRSDKSRGFGYGRETLNSMLAENPSPDLASGAPILNACRQDGQYATKYSSVYNLNTGDISLLNFSDSLNDVHINLYEELKKGKHYYDIPKIHQQIHEPPLLLKGNMENLPSVNYLHYLLGILVILLPVSLFFVRKKYYKKAATNTDILK